MTNYYDHYSPTKPPIEEDIRHEDLEYNPALEPKSARAWINLLEESEKAFETWNDHCDNIDRQYASLARLAEMARDKEFQMFWANCEVLKPAIYAKAPVPVVVPKFKDRRPVYTAASEVMERCATVAFDLAYVNEIMLQIRDDLALINRGVAWCRYEGGGNGFYNYEKVCIDFKHRRDFLHSISRSWSEVTWVAAASYLTRSEARDRFAEFSGDCYQDAEYRVDKDSKEVGGADNRERAKFWEIWHRGLKRVVWVAEGVEDILDDSDPHLDLQGFFPCPKPAYGTCQRGSLVPVPDIMQYRDQLDEVNMLTGRIHALSDALEAKGFYPSGGAELSEAIQAAVKYKTPGQLLVPISNWAAFGGTKDVIVWLPIDMIAQTITALVDLRKQVIEDIYQVMGLSDIMRGATDPRETLGSQELKTQYGSTRIRDKQYELVRIARDLVCIISEIITQKFDPVTIIEMSQTQLITQEMQQEKAQGLQAHIQGMQMQIQRQMQSPQIQQMMQANPQQAQAMLQQAQAMVASAQSELQNILSQTTIDQVFAFFKNNRIKYFVLDIETDSTIIADENSEKQRRSEFLQMLGGLLPQLMQLVSADPSAMDFAGELLKFAVAPYRAGRTLDGAIDDFVEKHKQMSGSKPDDPTTATNKTALQIEQIKSQRQADKDKADTALKAQEIQMRDAQEKAKIASNERLKLIEIQQRQADDAARARMTNEKTMQQREAHQADLIGKAADMQMNRQKMAMQEQQSIAKRGEMAARTSERQAAQQFKQAQQPLL